MSLFKSLVDLGTNIADVALAPVEIAADVMNGAVVKPLKEIADDCKDGIKELTDTEDTR